MTGPAQAVLLVLVVLKWLMWLVYQFSKMMLMLTISRPECAMI